MELAEIIILNGLIAVGMLGSFLWGRIKGAKK